MSNANPVNAWDTAVLLASDATLGTTIAPTAAQAFEFVSIDTGAAEVGEVRGKKDRNVGRNMQSDFVEGRVKPMAFSIEASLKSRAANTTVPKESALMKAAGLLETVGGSSVAYTLPADPIGSAVFSGVSIYRVIGKGSNTTVAEQLRGGVIKSLSWSGGDKELMLKASGEAIGKYVQGRVESITVLIGATSLTVTGEDIYQLAPGYYQCESEVILVGVGVAGVFPITRAQLGTSAAAHTAMVLRPYIPALTYLGAPISEGGLVTVTFDGIALRGLSFNLDLTTGGKLLPGESGSKYPQGAVFGRNEVKGGTKLVVKSTDIALYNKATARKVCAVSFVMGSVAGAIYTFSLPQCEIEAPKLPDNGNDYSTADISVRVRDSAAGNDALSVTLT